MKGTKRSYRLLEAEYLALKKEYKNHPLTKKRCVEKRAKESKKQQDEKVAKVEDGIREQLSDWAGLCEKPEEAAWLKEHLDSFSKELTSQVKLSEEFREIFEGIWDVATLSFPDLTLKVVKGPFDHLQLSYFTAGKSGKSDDINWIINRSWKENVEEFEGSRRPLLAVWIARNADVVFDF